MGYVGLATGAGAGEGLETLLARMRAEETLRNQGRSIDIDKFNAESLDTNRRGALAENTRQFDVEAPNRAAQVGSLEAGARENNASADILGEKASIIKGLRPILEGGGGTSGAEPVAGLGVGPGGSPGALNNPLGRLRLSLAGVPPGEVVGPVENPSEGEAYLDRYARSKGFSGRDDVRFTHDMELAALKEKPQTVISQGNLDIRSRESGLRQRESNLRISAAEAKLKDVPVFQRELALAEFRNRITNDVKSKQSWTQWWNGEDVPDPSAQIEQIAADVMTKYGTAATTPGSGTGRGAGAGSGGNGQTSQPTQPGAGGGDDLDEILRQRRGGR